MNKFYLAYLILGVVYSESCVYDAANFLEIYDILKSKKVQNLTKKSVNGDIKTKVQIQTDPTKVQPQSIISSTFMVTRLFVPLQIIDISEDLAVNSKFMITDDTIIKWEKKYGKIPVESIILLRTNHRDKTFNGWDDDFLDYVFNERNATGVGYDQIKSEIQENHKKYFINKLLITETDDLSKNSEYGNLAQINKLNEVQPNLEWNADMFTIIPEMVCSAPRRLISQWGTIIFILLILLGLIALIWYCCLKRFDKYNKEEFHLQDWETRNQQGVYHDKEELNIPLSQLHKKSDD